MREINEIIVHCAYTKKNMDVGFEEIDQWHKERGFRSPSGIHCGYHKIIRRDGTIEDGRPYEEAGAHCKGRNSKSIGICLVGGFNDADFTIEQYEALLWLVGKIIADNPDISIHGHRDFSDKACPCFDVNALLGR